MIIRLQLLQNAFASFSANKENNEIGRRREDDICGNSGAVCEGLPNVHNRVDLQELGLHGTEQEEDFAGNLIPKRLQFIFIYIQKIDIANCIVNTDIFDFLLDIIPKSEQNQIRIEN